MSTTERYTRVIKSADRLYGHGGFTRTTKRSLHDLGVPVTLTGRGKLKYDFIRFTFTARIYYTTRVSGEYINVNVSPRILQHNNDILVRINCFSAKLNHKQTN